jgi:hypothetical protein
VAINRFRQEIVGVADVEESGSVFGTRKLQMFSRPQLSVAAWSPGDGVLRGPDLDLRRTSVATLSESGKISICFFRGLR